MEDQELFDPLEVLKELAERIETCRICDGSGLEPTDPQSACRNCGGQGRVLDGTSLITEIEDAINIDTPTTAIFAAAPELLRCLKDAVVSVRVPPIRAACEAAIARAEGED